MKLSLGDLIRAANQQVLVQAEEAAIARYFAGTYVAHPSRGGPLRGHDWVARYVSMLHAAFEELSVHVEVLVETEDLVAWYRQVRGKHAGAFMGFPATGSVVSWRDMATSRFQDGRIVEDWVVSDLAEQLLRAAKRS